MAEFIAVTSFVSVVWSLAKYGTEVVKRLNEFRTNVRDLPRTFLHIGDQLPLLINTVDRLHGQAKDGDLNPETQTALRPVVEGIHVQLAQFDSLLINLLPSAKASTWEKGIKAVQGIRVQKTVDDFASVIDRYVLNLTIYQTTRNGDLIKTLISLIERTSSQKLHTVQVIPSRKPFFMVRYQADEDFIGREDIMVEIERRFGKQNRVAIVGMGGVGKSRIAIEYCYQHRKTNPAAHVFWVHGGSKARFEAAYQDLARTMKIPGFDDPKSNTLELVSNWLSDDNNGSWLIVLDNTDDAKIWIGPTIQESSQQDSPQWSAPLVDYIPRGSHGFVLITTRDSQLGKRLANVKEKPIDVLPFGPKEAEILLCRKLSEDGEISQAETGEITKALDYLPLAITQAAAYLDQNNMTIAKYLQLFRAGKAYTSDLLKKGIYDPGRDYEIQNSVFQTWRISFSQISKQDSRAGEILSLMAVLDRQAISENLLRKHAESELELTEAIQKLKAFSLITQETDATTWNIHRLVQLSAQKWLEQENKLSEWQEAALLVLAEHCPPDAKYENWVSLEALNPHLQVVLDYQFTTKHCQLQRAKILNILGWYSASQGRYSIAYQHYSESLALRKSHLGLEHPDTLISMNDLALVLQDQGKYDEAEQMHRQELELEQKVSGPEHPNAMISMNNLALVLYGQGKYDEAEQMQRQVLEVRERVFGSKHPDTLTSMNNLGSVLCKQGKYGLAEQMYQHVLEVREKMLGSKHPDTLTSMNNLGSVLGQNGKYGQAEQMHQQVLEVREKVLGPKHPDTLRTMDNLGLVLCEQGKYGEAEQMHQQVLEVREKVLGPKHPSTLRSMDNLACALGRQDKHHEAEEIFRRILELSEKVLDSKHPDILRSMDHLAWVLGRQGKYYEAEKMHRQVLEWREIVLNLKNPATLISMDKLAWMLAWQDKWIEAVEMHQQALEMREKVLGPEHPDTLSSVHGLAYLYQNWKRYDDASIFYQRAYSGYQKRLGSEHPITLECSKNYLSLLEEMK